MRIGRASGVQVAFFTFAGLLLLVPATRFIVRSHDWAPEQAAFIERYLVALAMGFVIVAIGPLRRWAAAELAIRVPQRMRRETTVVTLAGVPYGFAVVGALALGAWITQGPAGLAQWVRSWPPSDLQMARALSPMGLATFLVTAVIGPIAEELIFRGMLFKLWEEKWGWLPAMILSSAVFGLYHAGFWHAFVHGIVFAILYRRTGSLVAPILAHGFSNALLWYPALGHVLFPAQLEVPGDLGSWSVHLACLLAMSVAIPAYLFMARDAAVARARGAP